MAMIKCPECGKDISDSAPVCPNCGYSFLYALPNKSQAKNNLLLVIAGAAVCLIAGIKWMTIVLIVGAVIEAIVLFIGFFATLLFGSRMIRVVKPFFAFDVGYVLMFFINVIRSFL